MRIFGLVTLDRWLLVHNPNLWCLRVHYVVPGSILACFAAAGLGAAIGDAMPNDYKNFEIVSSIVALLCGAVGFYWCYLQARQRYSLFQNTLSEFRTLLAYPFLIAAILLPTYFFDLASERRGNTVTGDDALFMIFAGLAATAMVGTWIFRSFTAKAIVTGSVSALSLTVLLIMLSVGLGVQSNSEVQMVLILFYMGFTGVAMTALARRRWPWATAASVLAAPAFGGMLAGGSNIARGSDWGFIAGFATIFGGIVVCMMFQPLLNRYRTFPQ